MLGSKELIKKEFVELQGDKMGILDWLKGGFGKKQQEFIALRAAMIEDVKMGIEKRNDEEEKVKKKEPAEEVEKDKELIEQIEKSKEDIKEGRVKPLDEVEEEPEEVIEDGDEEKDKENKRDTEEYWD